MPRSANGGAVDGDLHALVDGHFELSTSVPEQFFEAEAERVAHACWDMARRFHRGGRLLSFGNGAWASDAQHVSVEFVHPVIVGKRALPALALTNDSGLLGRRARQGDGAISFSPGYRPRLFRRRARRQHPGRAQKSARAEAVDAGPDKR